MFLYFLAAFFPVTEITKQILLYTHYSAADCIWYFPFQLCSLPIYLMPVYAKTKSPVLESFLIDFSLLGGVFAFFDQSGMHYDMPVLTVHSYLWHIMMIVTGIYLARRSGSRRTLKSYFPAAGLFLVFAGLATVLNLTLCRVGAINMFYISPLHHMNQVVFSDIAARCGDSFTRVFYLLCIIAGGGIINILSGFLQKKQNR